MKRAAIPFAAVLTMVMITQACAQQTGKKISNPQKISEVYTYDITLTYGIQKKEINPGIMGVNTGFTFKEEVNELPAFVTLTKNIRPSVLRFPGGTVANYYHPGTPGFGFVYDEVLPVKALHPLYMASQKRQVNILENFIALCKQSGAKAVFCANLLTGTPEEALTVIRRFKESGVELLGVELGNEYNLMMYRKQFPTPGEYVQKAKTFAAAIRKEFPGLKLGVILGDEVHFSKLKTQRGAFQHDWSMQLAKQNFFDAVIVHYYPKCNDCNTTYLEDKFQKSWEIISPYKTSYLDTLAVYVKKFFPGKKVWITEWNTGEWNVFDNTFLSAAFASEFLMKLSEANLKYNDLFEISNYHFLGPDGLIYLTKGKLEPVSTLGKYAASSSYFSFSYYSQAAKGSSVTSELQPAKNVKGLAVQTFRSDSAVSVYYVNSGNSRYNLHFTDQPLSFHTENMRGEYLSSAAGNTYFDDKYATDQLTAVKLDKKSSKGSSVLIEPYSIGYIEFKP